VTVIQTQLFDSNVSWEKADHNEMTPIAPTRGLKSGAKKSKKELTALAYPTTIKPNLINQITAK